MPALFKRMARYAASMYTRTVAGAASVLILGTLLVSSMAAASASIEQNAQTSGGDVEIEQESTVVTETGDKRVEHRSEQNVSKEPGKPAQVERTIERNVTGVENGSVNFNVQRSVDELDGGVNASQRIDGPEHGLNDREAAAEIGSLEANSSIDSSGTATGESTDTTQQEGVYGVIQNVVDAIIGLFP